MKNLVLVLLVAAGTMAHAYDDKVLPERYGKDYNKWSGSKGKVYSKEFKSTEERNYVVCINPSLPGAEAFNETVRDYKKPITLHKKDLRYVADDARTAAYDPELLLGLVVSSGTTSVLDLKTGKLLKPEDRFLEAMAVQFSGFKLAPGREKNCFEVHAKLEVDSLFPGLVAGKKKPVNVKAEAINAYTNAIERDIFELDYLGKSAQIELARLTAELKGTTSTTTPEEVVTNPGCAH